MEQFYTPFPQMFMSYPLYTNYQFALPISMFQPTMDLLLYSSYQDHQPFIFNFDNGKLEQEESSDTPKAVPKRKYSVEQSRKPLNDSKEEITKELKNKQKETYTDVTNRNILPNNLNLILSFIRRINKSGKYVERIIQKLKGDEHFSTKKFYAYQTYLKQVIPFHKNRYTLKRLTQHTDVNYNIYSLSQQKFYNKVCRILIDQFLKGEYLTNMLISSKIQRTSKKQHLKIRRYLIRKLQADSNEEKLYQDQLIE